MTTHNLYDAKQLPNTLDTLFDVFSKYIGENFGVKMIVNRDIVILHTERSTFACRRVLNRKLLSRSQYETEALTQASIVIKAWKEYQCPPKSVEAVAE